MKFEIVPMDRAEVLRKSFIQKFIDTAGDHYKKHISALIRQPCCPCSPFIIPFFDNSLTKQTALHT